MKRILGFFAVLLTTVLAPLTAQAAPVSDQNNPTVSGGFCYLRFGDFCGQSFQQGHTNISGAGVFVNPAWVAGDDTVDISIYSGYSGSPSGLIASGTSATVDSNSGWVDVFWSPAAVSLATTYYMVIESTQGVLVASFSDIGSYSGGNAIYNGENWAALYDLTFRTYYDDGGKVPEPASLALFCIALAGLGATRRKKAI